MRRPEKGPASQGGDTERIGPFLFIQPPGGQRLTGDTLALVDFALPVDEGERAADLGTGSGAVLLLLAWKSPVREIIGVELMKGPCRAARENVARNGLEGRVRVVLGDWREGSPELPDGFFDLVISNPPYMKASSSRISPDAERAAARTDAFGTVEDLALSAERLLAPDGRACFVFPVVREGDMNDALAGAGLKPTRLRYVHPSPGRPATVFLVEARRAGEGDENPVVEEPVYLEEKNIGQ